MTAVDHAELKRLADALRVPWSDRGWTLASLLKEARQAADGLDALLSEIEGLKAERDDYRVEAATLTGKNAALLSNNAALNEEVTRHLRTQAPDSWRPDREEAARIIACHLTDAPDTVCIPITITAGDLRTIYAALRPQTAESGK